MLGHTYGPRGVGGKRENRGKEGGQAHTQIGRSGDMYLKREGGVRDRGKSWRGGKMQCLVSIEMFIALCCRQTQNEFYPSEGRAVREDHPDTAWLCHCQHQEHPPAGGESEGQSRHQDVVSIPVIQDLVVVCGDGVSISTCRLLVAAISPWLRCLMEEAGEEFCLCLPSITGRQLENFLNTCLAEKQGEEIYFNRHTHEFILQTINPKDWERTKHKAIISPPKTQVVNLKPLEKALMNQYLSKQEKLDTFEEWEDVKEEIDFDYDEIEDLDPSWHIPEKEQKLKKVKNSSKQKVAETEMKNIDCNEKISGSQKNGNKAGTLLSVKNEPIEDWDPSEDKNGGTPQKATKRARGRQPGPQPRTMVKLCPDCGQEFKRSEGYVTKPFAHYEKHLMKHKIQNFSCDCADAPKLAPVDKLLLDSGKPRRKGNSIQLIERHMKLVHMGWVSCSQCETIFKNEVLLSTHLKKHGRSIVCDKCGFEADTTSKMQYHMLNIHDTNEAVCDVCSKTFRNIRRLKDHIANCHNEKECKLCGKTVKHLDHHIQIMHQPDSEKMFKCPDCEKAFINKRKLASHQMNVHIKSQPHRCR